MQRVERSLAALMLVALLSFGGGLALDASGAIDSLDTRVTDALMNARDDRRVPGDIVTVALDRSATRREHARVIDELHRRRPKLIAYDVAFVAPKTRNDDDRLFRALVRARPLVLASISGDAYKPGYVVPHLFKEGDDFDAAGIGIGVSAYPREPDRKIRRIALAPLELSGRARQDVPDERDPLDMPSFAYVVATALGGGQLSDSVSAHNDEIIDFHGPPGTFKSVRFDDVLKGDLPGYVFRDKLVIVGETHQLNGRSYSVPTGDHMDPVELDANAIATLVSGAPLRRPDRWFYALVLIVGSLLPIAAAAAGPWTPAKLMLLGPSTAIAIVAGAWPNFDEIIFWPLVYAAAAFGVSSVGTWFVLARSARGDSTKLGVLDNRREPPS